MDRRSQQDGGAGIGLAATAWKRGLLAGGILFVLGCLPPAQAQVREDRAAAAAMGQALARLELTDEQSAQLRPMFKKHLEEQVAVLEQYGALSGERGSGRRSNLENAQKMLKALSRNNEKFEKRAAKILSDAQMSQLRQLQQERREAFRERASSARMKRLGETLELTDEQLAAATPIFANHVETQLAIFEKHGIELGSREKAGFRKLIALRRDTNAVNERTLRLLSNILTEEQLAKYKTIQDEQRSKVRDRIR